MLMVIFFLQWQKRFFEKIFGIIKDHYFEFSEKVTIKYIPIHE